MHKNKRVHGRTGGAGKTAVFGMLDRRDGKSKVRTQVIPEAWKETVNEVIKDGVHQGADVYSDEHGAYFYLGQQGFNHAFVRHAEYYVEGSVHTNGIENFWSLLKRGIKAPTLALNRSICFVISMSNAFVSMRDSATIRTASWPQCKVR